MSYSNLIPQPNDRLKDSQVALLNNFSAIETLITVNHGNFGSVNEGKHEKVSLPVAALAPVFAAGEEGLYTLLNATTVKNELYVHRQTIDAPTDIPFTASILSNTAIAGCGNGWSYLPSGLLIKWGSIAAPAATVAITPTAISGGPNFTEVFRVSLTARDTSAAVNFTCGQRTSSVPPTGNFDAYCANPTATTSINYFIIGV